MWWCRQWLFSTSCSSIWCCNFHFRITSIWRGFQIRGVPWRTVRLMEAKAPRVWFWRTTVRASPSLRDVPSLLSKSSPWPVTHNAAPGQSQTSVQSCQFWSASKFPLSNMWSGDCLLSLTWPKRPITLMSSTDCRRIWKKTGLFPSHMSNCTDKCSW